MPASVPRFRSLVAAQLVLSRTPPPPAQPARDVNRLKNGVHEQGLPIGLQGSAPRAAASADSLFDNVGDAEVQLEQVRAVEAPGVTHVKYRSVK